jgi:hypothetical protein
MMHIHKIHVHLINDAHTHAPTHTQLARQEANKKKRLEELAKQLEATINKLRSGKERGGEGGEGGEGTHHTRLPIIRAGGGGTTSDVSAASRYWGGKANDAHRSYGGWRGGGRWGW